GAGDDSQPARRRSGGAGSRPRRQRWSDLPHEAAPVVQVRRRLRRLTGGDSEFGEVVTEGLVTTSRERAAGRRWLPARSAGQPVGPWYWLRVSSAPCGSRTTAIRVYCVSNAGVTSSAPSSIAFANAASASATPKMVPQCAG